MASAAKSHTGSKTNQESRYNPAPHIECHKRVVVCVKHDIDLVTNIEGETFVVPYQDWDTKESKEEAELPEEEGITLASNKTIEIGSHICISAIEP